MGNMRRRKWVKEIREKGEGEAQKERVSVVRKRETGGSEELYKAPGTGQVTTLITKGRESWGPEREVIEKPKTPQVMTFARYTMTVGRERGAGGREEGSGGKKPTYSGEGKKHKGVGEVF